MFSKEGKKVELTQFEIMIQKSDNLFRKILCMFVCSQKRLFAMHDKKVFADICSILNDCARVPNHICK